ncbi:MAG: FHA domain-containing protein [Candidatus Schekmanbacteria bacterium]|nr:FHA domain-containing protein [Candidatus Schekmanbacteria bacterium]
MSYCVELTIMGRKIKELGRLPDDLWVTFGRGPWCDFLAPGRYRDISRVHCGLRLSGSALLVHDLSTYGVYLLDRFGREVVEVWSGDAVHAVRARRLPEVAAVPLDEPILVGKRGLDLRLRSPLCRLDTQPLPPEEAA